jgi:hypothetical protein
MTCNYRRTLFRAVACICLPAKRLISKFAVYDFEKNNLSTSSYIHHPLHTPSPTLLGHPCSKHQQYVSPATINPCKLEMSFKSNQAHCHRGNLRRMSTDKCAAN